MVLRTTVLPPALGPEMTRVRTSGGQGEVQRHHRSLFAPAFGVAEDLDSKIPEPVIEQRVPGARQSAAPTPASGNTIRPPAALPKRTAAWAASSRREDLDGTGELVGGIGEGVADQPQDPLELVSLLGRGLGQGVVEFDGLEGFDERRGAARRGVEEQTRESAIAPRSGPGGSSDLAAGSAAHR